MKRGMLFWETARSGCYPPRRTSGRLAFRATADRRGARARAAIRVHRGAGGARLEHRESSTPSASRSPTSTTCMGGLCGGGREESALTCGRPGGTWGTSATTSARWTWRSSCTEIAAAKPDVLFVSASLAGRHRVAAADRQAQHVHLLANIGTSSSYCMPAFGETLGKDAVGVYASDKPSASSIDPSGLPAATQRLLARADAAYRAQVGSGA